MGRGYSGADLIASLNVEYEYQGHDFDDFGDMTNRIRMMLSFAQDTDNYATNVQHIMEQAEEYARAFVMGNNTIDTGELYNSIESKRVNANQWTLHAPARDLRKRGSKGTLYAGHIEYGFTDKRGQPHGPWPFLRPAVQLAAMDSRGELAKALSENMLYGRLMTENGTGSLSLGRSGQYYSHNKGSKSFSSLSNSYRRWDTKSKSTKEWGKARNGFNDYSGRFEKGTTSNEYTTGTSEFWDWGEL